ncbi:PKD-like family lipoprotein [Pedobacter lusitanus]|nr:PKD-like family lipoprotein [Pedobacter lusitanus]
MLKTKYICLVIFAVLILFSCKKDLGNYTYTEVNKVEFTTLGSNDTVTAIYGTRFMLKPEIKSTMDQGSDTSRYSYTWVYEGPNGLGGNATYTYAKTKNLDVVMGLAPMGYTFYYTVTDRTTGIKFIKRFQLNVKNEINEGWLLNTEVGGTARLDMLSKKSDGNFTLITDLLKTTASGLELKGKPVMVYTYSTGLLIGPDKISYGLYVGTDQTTTKINPETFKWTKTMDLKYEMFGAIPTGFYADLIRQAGSNAAYMLGKGNVYYYFRALNIYYATPVNYIDIDKKSFTVAPFVANDETSSEVPAILYDQTNKRFVKHIYPAASSTTIPDPADKLFSFSTGKDLLFMNWVGFNGGEVFAVLKDPASEKRYLARFNSQTNAQSYYAEITGTGIARAEQYAISPDLGYLFYNVGSKVYEYDMSLKTTKLMLDKGNAGISLLKFQNYKSFKYKDGNKLIVCSYDPSGVDGSNGTMEQFIVPPLNADLQLSQSFTGMGKIQSINYRER